MKKPSMALYYIKRATLSALSFYLCMIILSAAENALKIEGLAKGTFGALVVALFAFLTCFYPAFCSYKIADLKDPADSAKWRLLQLSHSICCLPLWYVFMKSSDAAIVNDGMESIQTIATRIFIVFTFATLAPLIGFAAERFVKNQRWNRR